MAGPGIVAGIPLDCCWVACPTFSGGCPESLVESSCTQLAAGASASAALRAPTAAAWAAAQRCPRRLALAQCRTVAWLTQPTHQRSAQLVRRPVALDSDGAQRFFGRHKGLARPHESCTLVWRAAIVSLGRAPNLWQATTEIPSPMDDGCGLPQLV